MKSKVQPTKPQRGYARASSTELYHKACTLNMHVHGLINLFMEYIVGTQRCRYGWQTLFPVAIPKSEDAVSSATLDLSENWGAVSGRVTPPAVSVNSIQMIQFHTHDTFVPCTLTKYFSPVIICSVGVIVRLIQQKWEPYLWEVCVRTSQTHRLGEGCDLLITIFVWKDLCPLKALFSFWCIVKGIRTLWLLLVGL